MNILVIGCDQVGASLIRDLEHIGHDISLIEKDPEQLKRLDAFDDYRFGGTALVGDPTDPDMLRQGGIENCGQSISCGSMMVTLWWWASRLWARYMPTLPPPAIQTFIRYTMRTADVASCDAFVAVTGADEDNLVACQFIRFPRFYFASARNTDCSVSTVGQMVSIS